MIKFHLLLIALAIVSLGWLGWRRSAAPLVPRVQHVDKASTTASKVDPPTDIENDPLRIFQRAFWASPAPEDDILHAERREWKDADDVQKWQWFLVVEPSAALLKRLRDDNAFGLIPAAATSPPTDAPEWFAFNKDEVSALKASLCRDHRRPACDGRQCVPPVFACNDRLEARRPRQAGCLSSCPPRFTPMTSLHQLKIARQLVFWTACLS